MDDLLSLRARVTLAIFAALALLYVCTQSAHASRTEGVVDGDYCDPSDGARSWSRADKQRTRDRVRHACEAVGGSATYCAFWDAAIVRESWGGVASAVHTLGADSDGASENGRGPIGLSLRWQRDAWPGTDEDPAFCTPEVSFLVGHTIALKAVRSYGASNAIEIQAIYGGGARSHACFDRGIPGWVFHFPLLGWLLDAADIDHAVEVCVATPQIRHQRAVCARMGEAECRRPLTISDLGQAGALVTWDRARARYVVTAQGRVWALDRARR